MVSYVGLRIVWIFKVFVVNCGEIVVWVIWVVCDVGLFSVVVYVEFDVEFLYVWLVDEVFVLGG